MLASLWMVMEDGQKSEVKEGYLVMKQASLRQESWLKPAVKIELEALTLYAFSSENWSRPKKEVSGLMSLFEKTIEKYTSLLIDNNVRFKTAGDPSMLPKILKRKLEQMESITSENTGLKLTLAIAYGGQQEIINGIKN